MDHALIDHDLFSYTVLIISTSLDMEATFAKGGADQGERIDKMRMSRWMNDNTQ